MTIIGSPTTSNATKLVLLGSGELGKEVAIEAQRYGIEVTAIDRYPNAPAMQVAHHAQVLNMQDETALYDVITRIQPHFIVPEIEAIATQTLLKLEQAGFNVIPTAKATHLTMNREGIRRLAAEELNLPTSPYQFADTFESFEQAVKTIGYPCVVKPVMSSSGKGQSVLKNTSDIVNAWEHSQAAGRTGSGRVIVEGFIDFDYEITLLTVRHQGGTSFCAPIGHYQQDGDYRESWQPHPMSVHALNKAEAVAKQITDALGGYGVFGVELFIRGDEVYFSEVSPRPHDTGMVTLMSQSLSEFALHVRALLGLPIPHIEQLGSCASYAILSEGTSESISYHHLDKALMTKDTEVRLFGKSSIAGRRRLGVALARGNTLDKAREKARLAGQSLEIQL